MEIVSKIFLLNLSRILQLRTYLLKQEAFKKSFGIMGNMDKCLGRRKIGNVGRRKMIV